MKATCVHVPKSLTPVKFLVVCTECNFAKEFLNIKAARKALYEHRDCYDVH